MKCTVKDIPGAQPFTKDSFGHAASGELEKLVNSVLASQYPVEAGIKGSPTDITEESMPFFRRDELATGTILPDRHDSTGQIGRSRAFLKRSCYFILFLRCFAAEFMV